MGRCVRADLHTQENLRKFVQIVWSSVLDKVLKRVVVDDVAWLPLPHAKEGERRVGLPQVPGERPAVGVVPGLQVICILLEDVAFILVEKRTWSLGFLHHLVECYN